VKVDFCCASQARPGGQNEDFIVVSPAVAALLDGAGIPVEVETGCTHGVRWYVQRLAGHLVMEAADPGTGLTDALARAITVTTDAHRSGCDPAHPRSPSATVIVVRFAEDRLDWLVLGDSALLLTNTADGIEAISDRRLHDVAGLDPTALATHSATPDGYDDWLALLDRERAARNRPGGYWIAAGDPTAAHHALTGTRNLTDLREIVLASDGATRPVEEFGVDDWPALLATARRPGPAAWLARVRELEFSDPDCHRWPRAKTHDDATLAVLKP
jgi:hypothetical protein